VAAEGDSTLDTSIACDSCDKWYVFYESFQRTLLVVNHNRFLIPDP
jgi:hypothetical protein